MSFLPLNELPALFPHVVDWISYLEKQAQESGRALVPIEFNLAQHVGVSRPEEVRILSVPRIPLPSHPRVIQLAEQGGLLSADTRSLTAGHGVIVRLDCADNLWLLAHEFVHVAQYERLGREGFLQEYIQRIAAHGYPDAPFELEAEAKASNAMPRHPISETQTGSPPRRADRTRSSGDLGLVDQTDLRRSARDAQGLGPER